MVRVNQRDDRVQGELGSGVGDEWDPQGFDEAAAGALESLELAPGTLQRPLRTSQRSVLLERRFGEGPSPIPWDRDLVLTVDVRAFALADLLSLIHSSRKSGYLLFNHEDHEKSVFLHRGEVVFATSNQRVDRLGECLLREERITSEQHAEAERRFTREGRFGKVLVELGVLTPRDLWDAVKLQVEDVVRSLFAYAAGEVHFWEGEIEPDNIVRLSLPTKRLISEGLRRRDELMRFLVMLEATGSKLEVLEGMQGAMSASERAFIDGVASGDEFGTICRRVGLDPLSAARTVKLLILAGAIRLERGAASEGDDLSAPTVPDPEGRICQSVNDHLRLLSELLSPLIAVEGQADVADRLALAIAEVGMRHPGLLGDVPLGAAGLPDADELLTRALRVAGDRERIVSSALTEVAAYLEFELRNHPQIEDATPYLEAVEPLRAKLEI